MKDTMDHKNYLILIVAVLITILAVTALRMRDTSNGRSIKTLSVIQID